MLKLIGTVHVRLLLSPDVPFVRTATLSLPELPEFDLTAKPLRKDLGLDAMSLPLIKPFGAFCNMTSHLQIANKVVVSQQGSTRRGERILAAQFVFARCRRQ